MNATDLELLSSFARHHTEDAFTEIVRRHLDLVHSAALRQVRSPQLAEEVAQSAFTDLARNAHRLAPDTIVTAWLYQVTRRTAIDVVRRETRRQLREQIATEMNAMNSTAADWTHIEPLLDEAMSALDETDRTAVLLRYFENKSLREVGQTLGTSDDAAQKRVSRAIERLREFFAKRGVAVGASGLIVVISANAVQAAPAGLSASIIAAVTTAGIDLSTTVHPAMAATKTKVVAAAVIAAMCLPLALFWRQNTSLRRELAVVHASVTAASRPAEPSGPTLTADERQRHRLEHLELISLRGRVTHLANELRRLKADATTGGAGVNLTPIAAGADSILFSVALTNRVPGGHTLVAGGWSRDRMRGYLLITPLIQGRKDTPDLATLTVQSQFVTAPEGFWSQIGWSAAKSETRRSTLAGVLTPEQLDILLHALKDTPGAVLSNTSLAKRRNGEYVGIGYSRTEDDDTEGALMGIDLYPWIAADGESVDLEIRPSPVSTNTPIHPYLKAGQPLAPASAR